MEQLGLNHIRQLFKEFYVSKEHYPGKSASLVPKNDKSLLLINSGMAPLKNYFAGVETPPAKRMTTCQKCIRTGDIENVGQTARHGTFFEMLGNFSFGDYFKEESLNWGWEFITEVLKMPKDRLWATVYQDDDQAVEIWKKIGMPEERIVRLGKEDNFWEIGLGPCGPCSEIYFDRGPEYGCDCEDCKPGCDCDRYIEFWNHVFTQFSKEEDGSYSDLEHPNIDTGMGLERIACIMQGVDSIFDIDTVKYILEGVTQLSGVSYQTGNHQHDVSIRIITDHLRSMVFMISDGILPSNEGRGYVLRRIIRRAVRHGKLLGVEDKFLYKLADRVISVSGDAYPELKEKADYIKKTIMDEENKFAITLNQGCDIIAGYIKEMEAESLNILEGEKVFKLYDTYGFPLELTEEILQEAGYKADVDGFAKAMENQKEMARRGRKSTEGEAWKEAELPANLPETVFVGYEQLETTCKVLAIISKEGLESEALSGTIKLVTDISPCYAEGGGQVYDTGVIIDSSGQLIGKIVDVQKSKGVFAHTVELVQRPVEAFEPLVSQGDLIQIKVDEKRRNNIARNHTATHLLHSGLRAVLGEHVTQAGSLVNDKLLRFDFHHGKPLTEHEIRQVELFVNEAVDSFIPVNAIETSMSEAKSMGAMALFDEKYGENVRVIACEGVSTELCGGTHLNNTGQIGALKITSETGVSSGVRRIEAVTGRGVYEIANNYQELCQGAAAALKCNVDNLVEKSASFFEQLKTQKKELEDLKKQLMSGESDDLMSSATVINGISLVTKSFEDLNMNDLRNLSDDIKKEHKSVVMVFAALDGEKGSLMISVSDDLVESGIHAGKLIKDVAAVCDGKGGGKADMAQAGIKDISKLEEAFALAAQLIK